MTKKQLYSLSSIILFTGFLGIGIGHGCAPGYRPEDNGSSADLASTAPTTTDSSGFIPGAKTVSVVYANQVLDNFTACTGVTPSTTTVNTYNTKKGSISETGAASTVTAPMLMAITSIAGEVCNDLINKENATGATRNFFVGINFSTNAIPADAQLNDAIRKFARACWRRNETDDERSQIVSQVNAAMSAGTNKSRNSSLFICTSMLSSLDALTL